MTDEKQQKYTKFVMKAQPASWFQYNSPEQTIFKHGKTLKKYWNNCSINKAVTFARNTQFSKM